MTSIIHDCPRCNGKGSAFQLLYDVQSPDNNFQWFTVGRCGVCLRPSMFQLELTITGHPPTKVALSQIDEVVACEPQPPKLEVPDFVPDNVSKPFLEAEHSFAAGHFSAAGSCYRKAMERSLKHVDPNVNGMLNKRIRELEKKGLLPTGMIELLDQVRLFGNSSMHDDDIDPTIEDCTAAREFAQLFLTYIFSLPAKVAEAKAKIPAP